MESAAGKVPVGHHIPWESRCFKALDTEGRGYLYPNEVIGPLENQGVQFQATIAPLIAAMRGKGPSSRITYEEFQLAIHNIGFLKRVLEGDLIVPSFGQLRRIFFRAHEDLKQDSECKYSHGACADYIPTLAKANPDWFANSFCSADAQFCSTGDTSMKFSIQSISKAVAYAFIHNLIGDEVHRWVNCEPSGQVFNAPMFDAEGRPHNPMVNAGAIMVCSVIGSQGKGLDDLLEFWKKASNASEAIVDGELYCDEKATGYTNHALTSLMLARNKFPPSRVGPEHYATDAYAALDMYFKNCSILVDTASLAWFGATLANNGVNPATGERVMRPATVKATVTVMTMCGMYNGAGKYVKELGIPSKSGVSGCLLSVVPGVGGIASWSPKLNAEGNTVKGIGMIDVLSAQYSNFNLFHKDVLLLDATRPPFFTQLRNIIAAVAAAASGDVETLRRLKASDINLDIGDYDKRTPLHLAAANNHLDALRWLVEEAGVHVNPSDRWGATPLNDVTNDDCRALLLGKGATLGNPTPYTPLENLVVPDHLFMLIYAAFTNDVPLMSSLNIRGWRVNGYDYDGRTALGVAASEGNLDAVRYLVAHGADVSHKDARGNTALQDAQREGRADIVAFLAR